MKITRTMRSVACILVIAMFITLPVAALSSATTTKNSKWVQLYVRIKNFSLGIRSAEDPRFGVYQRWKL